ncbi:TPA: NACHT domain-containing protein [Serratia marcescens]
MVALSTLVAESLLAGFFKSIGSAIADSSTKIAKGKGNKIIESFNNSTITNDYLSKAVYKIFAFRTITKGDRDVYLDEVYHPLKISKGGLRRGRKINIGDKAKIKNNGCSVIIGLAGQGKTTIMRKLFLEEVVRKERLPLFLTLRQYSFEGKSCEDIILEHLSSNGIDCKPNDVVDVLKTKKVIIFFDGFDEVISSQRSHALNLISSVFDKYGCPSIVTTRPDTEITRHPGTTTYFVEYLKSEDVKEMVVKIVNNQDVSSSILTILQQKSSYNKQLKPRY